MSAAAKYKICVSKLWAPPYAHKPHVHIATPEERERICKIFLELVKHDSNE